MFYSMLLGLVIICEIYEQFLSKNVLVVYSVHKTMGENIPI